jgi:hypothetical protein
VIEVLQTVESVGDGGRRCGLGACHVVLKADSCGRPVAERWRNEWRRGREGGRDRGMEGMREGGRSEGDSLRPRHVGELAGHRVH